MAPHSSTLAWKISWTEEPGRLQSMGNPREWGAWWAAIYGVAQSQTRLKRLRSSSRSNKKDIKSRKFKRKIDSFAYLIFFKFI